MAVRWGIGLPFAPAPELWVTNPVGARVSPYGEVAEWSKAAVLKTVDPRGSGGSNPSLSAITTDSQRSSADWGRGATPACSLRRTAGPLRRFLHRSGLAETLRRNVESAVELAGQVLESDESRQLDNTIVIEIAS